MVSDKYRIFMLEKDVAELKAIIQGMIYEAQYPNVNYNCGKCGMDMSSEPTCSDPECINGLND